MKLISRKKTATGLCSTGKRVMEGLANGGNELAATVLEFRHVSKLKATFTDKISGFADSAGRVHTNFKLAGTGTGRLASSDPNLQNIPARSVDGRRIRQAFIAPPGYKLVSADYSQIELRVLDHVVNIPQLREAFAAGAVVHAATASEMFGVPIDGMPPELRNRAKTINFGIIYGIGAIRYI